MYLLFFALTLIATSVAAILFPLDQWYVTNGLGFLAVLVALWIIPLAGKREKSNLTIANFGTILWLGPVNLAASITAFIYSFRVDSPLSEILNICAFGVSLLILILVRISSKIVSKNQRTDDEYASFKNIRDRLQQIRTRSNDKQMGNFIILLVQDIEYFPTWTKNPPSNITKINELVDLIEAREKNSPLAAQLEQLEHLKSALAAAREEIFLSRGIRSSSTHDV
jgi:hypothetical protein